MNPLELKHSDFKYLYFDSDLREVFKISKELADVVKVIQNRFVHKETTHIAKSVFNYVEKKDLLYYQPQLFYDFRFGDIRICIAPDYDAKDRLHHYYIQFHNYKPDFVHNKYFSSLLKKYHYGFDGRFYMFDTLDDAIKQFNEFVLDCINERILHSFNFR